MIRVLFKCLSIWCLTVYMFGKTTDSYTRKSKRSEQVLGKCNISMIFIWCTGHKHYIK